MPKAKDQVDTELATRRRRLETLRNDCQRQLDGRVRLLFAEGGHLALPPRFGRFACRLLKSGRAAEMAIVGADRGAEERAQALLARLGELISPADGDAGKLTHPEELAMFTLAKRARETSTWSMPEGGRPPQIPELNLGEHERIEARLQSAWSAAGMVKRINREVPDIRAAIADYCEELLGEAGAPLVRTKTPISSNSTEFNEPSGNDAQLLRELWLHDRGEFLSGSTLVTSVGIEPRPLRKLIGRLTKAGWPIDTKQGATGGYRLAHERLSSAQKAWLRRR
jgi:hypothetical protein